MQATERLTPLLQPVAGYACSVTENLATPSLDPRCLC